MAAPARQQRSDMTAMAQVLCEWGFAGMAVLRERADVLVVVDVLSFATAVDVAVARGAIVFPFAPGDPAAALREADALRAELAAPRGSRGRYNLSPASLRGIAAGTRLLLPSPNGSRIACEGGERPVLLGCLRNAAAVARAARELAGTGTVGVVPAGERWPDGTLRPAIEDLLGAGAIIHHLGLTGSAEALTAADAYLAAGEAMGARIRDSVSGRELIGRGFGEDVEIALEFDAGTAVPVLRDGGFRAG
jgi:2-phosphosulfolactate phosphatase